MAGIGSETNWDRVTNRIQVVVVNVPAKLVKYIAVRSVVPASLEQEVSP